MPPNADTQSPPSRCLSTTRRPAPVPSPTRAPRPCKHSTCIRYKRHDQASSSCTLKASHSRQSADSRQRRLLAIFEPQPGDHRQVENHPRRPALRVRQIKQGNVNSSRVPFAPRSGSASPIAAAYTPTSGPCTVTWSSLRQTAP